MSWTARLRLFEAFHAREASFFERRESREQAKKYLRGLLSSVERKDGWQLAEIVGDATPARTQRLLHQVNWDAESARDRLQQFVIETFGDEEGIGVVVRRQYCGAAGTIENGQVARVLSYASKAGHIFLDRRLSLPQEEWCRNRARCAEAKVPEEIRFQTKPEQAINILEHAWEQGAPMRLS